MPAPSSSENEMPDHAVIIDRDPQRNRRATDSPDANGMLRDAKRLFGRRAVTRYADVPPVPRHRDDNRQIQPRTIHYDHPLPEVGQLQVEYADALKLIARYRPLRAAYLGDMLSRADAGLIRYGKLLKEEEERHQNYNEEVRRAEDWLDAKIQHLRAERDQIAGAIDAEIEKYIETRAIARERGEVARAHAGLPIYRALPEGDPEDQAETDRALPAPPQTETSFNAEGHLNVPLDGIANPLESMPRSLFPNGIKGALQVFGRKAALTVNESEPPTYDAAPPEPLPARVAPTPVSLYPGHPASLLSLQAPEPPVIEPPVIIEPAHVEFPIDEAHQQAPKESAIAIDQGVLPTSPAYINMWEGKRNVLQAMKTLALITCGAVFGASLAIIFQFDLSMLSYAPGKVGGLLAIFFVLGISLYWLLGHIFKMVAGLIADQRYSGLHARHTNEPTEMGWKSRHTAVKFFLIFLLIFVSLVSIEAMVEKEGIVHQLQQSMVNQNIVAGVKHSPEELNLAGVLGLIFMVSVPFAYFHTVEGWITARKDAIDIYLKARRDKEAHRIAEQLYAERRQRAAEVSQRQQEAADEARRIRHDYNVARYEEDRANYNALRSFLQNSLNEPSETPEPEAVVARATRPAVAAYDASGGLAVSLETNPADVTEPETTAETSGLAVKLQYGRAARSGMPPAYPSTDQWAEIALYNQQAREAHARIREFKAKRAEAVAWYDRRIADLDNQRRTENPVPVIQATHRMEDAYHEFIGAVIRFDADYKQEIAIVEHLRAGGLFYRLKALLFRRPADDIEPSAEPSQNLTVASNGKNHI